MDFSVVFGPLDDERLGQVAGLYGPVDAKYTASEYLRHQFVENPFGWSVHVFAVHDGTPVGHCAAIPCPARHGSEPFVAAKVEAFVVTSAFRGSRSGRPSVGVELLERLQQAAHERGAALLFALAAPAAGRAFDRAGYRRVHPRAPTYVHIIRPSSRGPWVRRQLLRALFAAQQALLLTSFTLGQLAARQRVSAELSEPVAEDVELLRVSTAAGAWTLAGEDAWDWYAGSGLISAVVVSGRFPSRALVRFGETGVQIAAWRPRHRNLLSALLLIGAVARVARDQGAATLRFQSWHGEGGNGALALACRSLGFVKRSSELHLHATDAALAAADVELTPFFYLTY
jgi:hypothetical protein